MTILIKREYPTDYSFGFRANERPVPMLLKNCIVNINKPSGPSSHVISNYVKVIMGAKKAGHSGTLDPNVTGVLPVGTDNATKAITYLLSAGKEYVAHMLIHSDVSEDIIRKSADEFRGTIDQMVPIKAAVKRQMRKRTIYELDIIEIDGRNVLFRVKCQAGTYVRKLIHDWGLAMGSRAHMEQLVRTKVGFFTDENMVSLQDLTDAVEFYKSDNDDKLLRKIIHPIERALQHIPKVWIFDSAVDSLCHGAALKVPGISKLDDNIERDMVVCIMTLKDEIVGTGRANMSSDEIMKAPSGEAVRLERIMMDCGIYPKQPKKL